MRNNLPGSEPLPIAVEVARAALCEVGLVDLAVQVTANRDGIPTLNNDALHRKFRSQIARAFLLGHQAAGHPAVLGRGLSPDFEWVDSVSCSVCADRLEAMHSGEVEA